MANGQTIGSKLRADFRRINRQSDIDEYEDLRLLNKLKAGESAPGVQESRDLTIEDKIWKQKKLGIDSQLDVIKNFITDKDGRIKNDLTNEEIKKAGTELPKVIESISRIYNQEGDWQTENYINSLNVSLTEGLKDAQTVNYVEESLGIIEQQIKDLGDPFTYIHPRHGRTEHYVGRGEYDISENAQTILNNIKTFSDGYREIKGNQVVNPFEEFTKQLQKKQQVFEAFSYYSETSDGINSLKSSPKAQRVFDEVSRLMRTGGDEDIDRMQTLINKIPEMLGASDEAAIKATGKAKEDALKLENETFEDVGFAQLSNARTYYDDHFSKTFQKKYKQFAIPNYKEGTLDTKEGRKVAYKQNTRNIKTLLTGIKNFNEGTSFDNEDYVSSLNIKKMLEEKHPNMEMILRYFTDNREVETPNGVISLGEARLSQIKAGNESETVALQGLLSNLIDFEKHLRGKDPLLGGDSNFLGSDALTTKKRDDFLKKYGYIKD